MKIKTVAIYPVVYNRKTFVPSGCLPPNLTDLPSLQKKKYLFLEDNAGHKVEISSSFYYNPQSLYNAPGHRQLRYLPFAVYLF